MNKTLLTIFTLVFLLPWMSCSKCENNEHSDMACLLAYHEHLRCSNSNQGVTIDYCSNTEAILTAICTTRCTEK